MRVRLVVVVVPGRRVSEPGSDIEGATGIMSGHGCTFGLRRLLRWATRRGYNV